MRPHIAHQRRRRAGLPQSGVHVPAGRSGDCGGHPRDNFKGTPRQWICRQRSCSIRRWWSWARSSAARRGSMTTTGTIATAQWSRDCWPDTHNDNFEGTPLKAAVLDQAMIGPAGQGAAGPDTGGPGHRVRPHPPNQRQRRAGPRFHTPWGPLSYRLRLGSWRQILAVYGR